MKYRDQWYQLRTIAFHDRIGYHAKRKLDNIISEDNIILSRGREDWGASRTPIPEIGFMLGSAKAR